MVTVWCPIQKQICNIWNITYTNCSLSPFYILYLEHVYVTVQVHSCSFPPHCIGSWPCAQSSILSKKEIFDLGTNPATSLQSNTLPFHSMSFSQKAITQPCYSKYLLASIQVSLFKWGCKKCRKTILESPGKRGFFDLFSIWFKPGNCTDFVLVSLIDRFLWTPLLLRLKRRTWWILIPAQGWNFYSELKYIINVYINCVYFQCSKYQQ